MFDRLAHQRQMRAADGNKHTKKYEKTINGFLMRLYRNMESRVSGVQRGKAHLYRDRKLIDRDSFYWWAWSSPEFYRLFGEYRESGFSRKLAPSVDRVDSAEGYELFNMEWITMSENSRRGAVSRHNKGN